MPLVASTGPALVRCCQHRPSTCPAPTHNGMFRGGVTQLYNQKHEHRQQISIKYVHMASQMAYMTNIGLGTINFDHTIDLQTLHCVYCPGCCLFYMIKT